MFSKRNVSLFYNIFRILVLRNFLQITAFELLKKIFVAFDGAFVLKVYHLGREKKSRLSSFLIVYNNFLSSTHK